MWLVTQTHFILKWFQIKAILYNYLEELILLFFAALLHISSLSIPFIPLYSPSHLHGQCKSLSCDLFALILKNNHAVETPTGHFSFAESHSARQLRSGVMW